MIRETISKIEAKLKDTHALNDQTRRELGDLLGTLKSEITELSKTDAPTAQRIAGLTESSAHEAIREGGNPEELKMSLEKLLGSVDGFEKSHPTLVEIVNRIATTLSSLGI